MNEQYHPYPEQSIDEIIERLEAPRPTVIAFEGGPCGGKTTIANALASAAEERGRPVIVLPEVATELGAKLIENGLSIPYLAQHDRPGYLAFQKDLIAQIASNIRQATEQYAGTNALIIADRSDIGAYVSLQEYEEVLTDTSLILPPHTTLVDTIVYLPSLAHQDPSRYESFMKTNETRYETPADAVVTCIKNLGSVSMHPDLRTYWDKDFATKTQRVINEILNSEPPKQTHVMARGTSQPMLHAILEAAEAHPLEAAAITKSHHQDYELEHRITEAGGHLYYYASHNEQAPRRTTLSEREYRVLYSYGLVSQQSYMSQQHIITNSQHPRVVEVRRHNDGQWTIEVE